MLRSGRNSTNIPLPIVTPRLIIQDPLLSSLLSFVPILSKKAGACDGTQDFNMFIIHFYETLA